MIFKHSHRRTERRLRQMFEGGISAPKRRRLLAEVDTCDHCRAVCRSRYKAEAALSFAGVAGSPFAIERMGQGIFAQLKQSEKRTRPVGLKIAAVSVPVAAIALVILFLFPSSPSFRVTLPGDFGDNAVELVSRGGEVADSPDFGFRAFAVSRKNRHITENNRVSLRSLMTFTYTRTLPTDGYLALLGLQDSSDIIWYYPDYNRKESVRIQGDRVDEPLGDGFNISVKHKPGPLLIVALFSDKPILVRSIETWVDNRQSLNIDLCRSDRAVWKALGADVTAYSLLTTVEDDHD